MHLAIERSGSGSGSGSERERATEGKVGGKRRMSQQRCLCYWVQRNNRSLCWCSDVVKSHV